MRGESLLVARGRKFMRRRKDLCARAEVYAQEKKFMRAEIGCVVNLKRPPGWSFCWLVVYCDEAAARASCCENSNNPFLYFAFIFLLVFKSSTATLFSFLTFES